MIEPRSGVRKLFEKAQAETRIPRRRSFQRLPLSIKPQYLGNMHSPFDKVRNRHVAELLVNPFKLLFVNEDQGLFTTR
jgi:hypothetical protein